MGLALGLGLGLALGLGLEQPRVGLVVTVVHGRAVRLPSLQVGVECGGEDLLSVGVRLRLRVKVRV